MAKKYLDNNGAQTLVKKIQKTYPTNIQSGTNGNFTFDIYEGTDTLSKTTTTVNTGANNTVVESGTSEGTIKVTTNGTVTNPEVYGVAKLSANNTFSGNNTFSNNVTIPQTPTNNTHATSKKYVDDEISSKIAESDAMQYKGTLGTGGTYTTLPTTSDTTNNIKVGATLKVVTAGTYGGQVSKIGDLFIAQAINSSTKAITWDYIPSADENETAVSYITSGTPNISTTASYGNKTFGSAVTKFFETSVSNSDSNLPTGKAVKTYVDNGFIPNAGNTKADDLSITRDGITLSTTESALSLNSDSNITVNADGGVSISSESGSINLTAETGNTTISSDGTNTISAGNSTITQNGSNGNTTIASDDVNITTETNSGNENNITIDANRNDGCVNITALDAVDIVSTGGAVSIQADGVVDIQADNEVDITAEGGVYITGNGSDVVIEAVSGQITIDSSANNDDINFTTGTGKAYYNGSTANNEIATIGDISTSLSGYIPNAGNTVDSAYHIQRSGVYQIRMKGASNQYVSDSYKAEYAGGTTATVNHTVYGNVTVQGGSKVQANENVEVTAGHSVKVDGNTGYTNITVANGNITSDSYTSVDFNNNKLSLTADNGVIELGNDTLKGTFDYGHNLYTPYYVDSADIDFNDLSALTPYANIKYHLFGGDVENLVLEDIANCKITVIGDGRYKVINTDTLPATGVYFMEYPTNSEIVFDGVIIEDYDNIFNPINIPNTRTNVTFKNCFFTSTQTFNLPVSAYGTIKVENCTFEQDVQIAPRLSMNFTIKNCVFKGATGLTVQQAPTGYTFTGKGIITDNHFVTQGAGVTVPSTLTNINCWNNTYSTEYIVSNYIPNTGNTTTGNLTLSRSGDIGITSTTGDIINTASNGTFGVNADEVNINSTSDMYFTAPNGEIDITADNGVYITGNSSGSDVQIFADAEVDITAGSGVYIKGDGSDVEIEADSINLSASGIELDSSDTNANITLTTGTGKAYYNGETANDEIATVGATQSSKTIEGDFIHIEDAAPINVEGCVTTLEPIQAGSGDPSPENVRPITGYTGVELTRIGKNLFDNTSIYKQNYYIDTNGNEVEQSDYCISNKFKIYPNTDYTVSCVRLTNLDGIRLCWYDINNTFIRRDYNASNSYMVTSPSNAYYVALSYLNEGNNAAKNIQLELSSTATTYEPYTPETHSVTFPALGKNLLDLNITNLKSINTAGTWNNNVYTINSVTFTINSDNTITVNGTPSENTYIEILKEDLSQYSGMILNGCPENGSSSTFSMFMQLNQSPWERYATDNGNGATITTPLSEANSVIRCIIYANYTANNLVFKPMIRLASVTDPTYEPYTNTAYGCEVDWTNGVLTVNKVFQTGTLNQIKLSGTGNFAYFTPENIPKAPAEATVVGEIMCSEIKSVSRNYTDSGIANGVSISADGNIHVRNNAYSTEEEYSSWINNGTWQICYTLATPIEIPLTPEVITLLKGENNIYTNSGISKLTYQPDNIVGELKGEIQLLKSQIDTLINQLNNLSN